MPRRDGSSRLGHPDVAGWVLGALDPDHAERFAGHLLSCEECRAAVSDLEPVARLLQNPVAGADTAAVKPPADLEARTLTRVEWVARLAAAEAEPGTQAKVCTHAEASVRAAMPDAPQSVPERAPTEPGIKPAEREEAQAGPVVRIVAWRRASVRILSLAAAAVAVIGAGIAVWVARPAPATLTFTFPMHAASGGTASGQAHARQAPSGWSIQLTVHGLKDLGSGRFYECWYAGPRNRPGRPDLIAAGTFAVGRGGSATVQMWSAADPRSFPAMQITAEQPGDAGQHGQAILIGYASH
ncbi:MAG: zf-HC2 domain-containing protein [Actinomycetota bacterium]|nr:zf-HC2 domain-containing protein [Actinomycetota bacterium]